MAHYPVKQGLHTFVLSQQDEDIAITKKISYNINT